MNTQGPIRSCISCRGRFAKSELLRYTWVAAHAILDPQQKAEGRGAYCCTNARCNDKFHADRKRLKWAFRQA